MTIDICFSSSSVLLNLQLKEAQISELNGENDKRAKMSEAVFTMKPRDIESEVITTVGQPPLKYVYKFVFMSTKMAKH